MCTTKGRRVFWGALVAGLLTVFSSGAMQECGEVARIDQLKQLHDSVHQQMSCYSETVFGELRAIIARLGEPSDLNEAEAKQLDFHCRAISDKLYGICSSGPVREDASKIVALLGTVLQQKYSSLAQQPQRTSLLGRPRIEAVSPLQIQVPIFPVTLSEQQGLVQSPSAEEVSAHSSVAWSPMYAPFFESEKAWSPFFAPFLENR